MKNYLVNTSRTFYQTFFRAYYMAHGVAMVKLTF